MSKPKSNKSLDVPGEVLFELLTESEVRMVKNRWRIVSLIEEGLPIRKIAEMVNVGTDTVVRMSKKIRENHKIRQFLVERGRVNSLGKRFNPISSTSKWVFGQMKDK